MSLYIYILPGHILPDCTHLQWDRGPQSRQMPCVHYLCGLVTIALVLGTVEVYWTVYCSER